MRSPHSFFQRVTASALLLVYASSVFPVVPLYAALNDDTAPSPQIVLPKPVRTPTGVTVNRTAPSTVAKPLVPALSATPTDREIFRVRVFAEPFLPVAATTPADNAALAEAIRQYLAAGTGELSPFETFVATYPGSPWAPSVSLGLGLRQFSTGWFTKAIASYQAAWEATRDLTDARGRALADRAFGELVQMHARVGRMETLGKLFATVTGRDFTGQASELVAGARDGLHLMETHPELAFRCGPGALDRILRQKKGREAGFSPAVFNLPSTAQGTSFASVAQWAGEAGLGMQVAFREPGSAVITPSVVHWKLGHFAALFALSEGAFRIEDPTFGARMSASTASIDAEATGYFLVPAGPLPAGWRSVSQEEAATVWGKGTTATLQTKATTVDDTKVGCPAPSKGMPVANAHAMVVSLNLTDTPLGYTPPYGPDMPFTLTYNQREATQPAIPDFSNMGSKWVHTWHAFVDEDAVVQPNPHGIFSYYLVPQVGLPGGGARGFRSDWMVAQSYPIAFYKSGTTGDKLEKTDAQTYTLFRPDGSKLVYGHFTGASLGTYRFLLTEVVDPAGNAVTLGYDVDNRLVSLTDALGQVTTFAYELVADDLKLTKVTDPFGRYCTLAYDSSNRLNSVTDTLGLTSTFTYLGVSEIITSMTTPYGTSTFSSGESGTGGRNRWLEITNPLGEKERVECRDDWSGLPGAGPAPTGMDAYTGLQNHRNTLYWSRKAYKDTYNPASPDSAASVGGAHIYHWMHVDETLNAASPLLENEKNALEAGRIWYNYAGQPASYLEGTSSRPTKVGRVLDDTTTQLYQYEYNDFDRVTKATDPLGRETTYVYDTNLIDLLEVRQKTGSGPGDYEVLSQATYNAAHQPLTVTDAAGEVTIFTYNGNGQPLTVTNAKSEVTTFGYDTDGYLISVDGPLSGTGDSTTFAYDGYGRLRTVTDSEGYAVTTDYDIFDRPTLVTYPDTTTQQIVYDKLDASLIKDRRGRVTQQRYNAIRQVVMSTDPLGRVTQYGWCKCGALRLLIDPVGNTTNWSHDAQARLTGKQFADGTSVSYHYETNTSRLKSVIDAMGQVTNYGYFKDDQLQQVSYTNATVATPSVSFTYETYYPRSATMVDGVGTTTYAYNPITTTPTLGAGRLASIDGPWANDTIAYTYDELGRVLSRSIDGSNNLSSIGYDALGRVTGVTNPLGAFAYTYVNATGRLANVTYPNGQETNYSYFNNAGDQRLQQIENLKPDTSNLSTFAYTYDAEGIIQTWSRKYDAGSVLNSVFKYDRADQLTEASIPQASGPTPQAFIYRYDRAGNRTSEQIDNAVNAATVNNLNQLTALSASGPIHFEGSLNEAGTVKVNGQALIVASDHTFQGDVSLPPGSNTVTVEAKDAANNTVAKSYTVPVASGTGRTLTYDLIGNMADNGAGQAYEWDAVNRLTKITYASGAKSEFTYDGAGRRVKILEKNSGGSVTSEKRFGWDGMSITEERDGSSVLSKRFYKQGAIVGGGDLYYTGDHLGSIREVVASGTSIRYDYDPYGRVTMVGGSGDADFRYTGHYFHAVSGLSLAPYRAYDPNVGKWLSRDLIEESDGTNLYEYVSNAPLIGRDPLGLWNLWNPFTWGLPSSAGENPWNPLNDSAEWGATAEGAGLGAQVWFDEVIPFADPFADSGPGTYSSCDETLAWSHYFGSLSQNAALTALGLRGGAWLGGTRFGRLLNRNPVIRLGPGRMPKSGSLPGGPKVPRLSFGPDKPGSVRPHFDLRVR